jgi:hypothetical protein
MVSDGWIWQQAMPFMVAAESSQPCIIPWQHGGRADGAKQASAGIAVHKTTTTSNKSALFLPMRIVYALSRMDWARNGSQ